MMEKRNFVTSIRTPGVSTDGEKSAKANDVFDVIEETIEKGISEFEKKASEEDERSDKESPGAR